MLHKAIQNAQKIPTDTLNVVFRFLWVCRSRTYVIELRHRLFILTLFGQPESISLINYCMMPPKRDRDKEDNEV